MAKPPKDPWKVEDDGKIGEGREKLLLHLGAVGSAAERELLSSRSKIIVGAVKSLMGRVAKDPKVDQLHDLGGDVLAGCRGKLPTPKGCDLGEDEYREAVRQLEAAGWLRKGTAIKKGEVLYSFWQGERI